LHGILIEDGRQANSHAVILAQSGRLVAAEKAPRVVLLNGSRQELDRQTGRLNVLTFAENTIDLAQNATNTDQRLRDVGELSVGELLGRDARGQLTVGNEGKLQVEIHRRLTMPLTAVSFALVALVASLSGTFRRHGGIIRPVASIAVVVGLLALGLAFTNLAVRSPSLIPLLWLQAVLPGLVAMAWLFAPDEGWFGAKSGALRRAD
jgi:lipopolysaccharide export system permease protein